MGSKSTACELAQSRQNRRGGDFGRLVNTVSIKREGADYSHHITTCPPEFRPSYGPAAGMASFVRVHAPAACSIRKGQGGSAWLRSLFFGQQQRNSNRTYRIEPTTITMLMGGMNSVRFESNSEYLLKSK